MMGDVGSFIVFENDKVIIWELVLEPGSKRLAIFISMTIFFMCLKVLRWRCLIRMTSFCLPSIQTRGMLSHSHVEKASFFQVMAKAYR
jgi:hypothetical protein